MKQKPSGHDSAAPCDDGSGARECSATVNELMNRDPMWQMMRSSAVIADLEKHEQNIDRMLGLGR